MRLNGLNNEDLFRVLSGGCFETDGVQRVVEVVDGALVQVIELALFGVLRCVLLSVAHRLTVFF